MPYNDLLNVVHQNIVPPWNSVHCSMDKVVMCTLLFVQVQWVVSEDRGPNGASGRAKFKPSFSVGLLVTLYKV